MNREIFLKVITLGITSPVILLSACGDNTSKSPIGTTSLDTSSSDAMLPSSNNSGTPSNCNDISGLSNTDLAPRLALAYIPVSIEPDKNCGNCRFIKLVSEPNGCAGCQLFKGPVNTIGYCKSWFIKG
ncbi:MAG: high-potential iron-sulfur protein [Bacteroidia bacterium]|nr:high-potential iron-sulfur protein [Bacteroidia bacterium]